MADTGKIIALIKALGGGGGTGGVTDVQVNGQSIVSDGVANVPLAETNVFGALKTAEISTVKAGNTNQRAITPYYNHAAAFYGLAKAAGDTTQSQSDNAVGTYTDAAKRKIAEMLEPQFRLIKEITIDGNDTEVVSVSNDEAGNPFELHDIIIGMNIVGGSNNGIMAIIPNIAVYQAPESKANLCMDGGWATANNYIYAHIQVVGGKFFGVYYGDGNTSWYNSTYVRQSKNACGTFDCDSIESLMFRSLNTYPFVNGTKITVYGR